MTDKCGYNSRWLVILLSLASTLGFAEKSYSPHTDQQYPQNVYWGDTHLHTSLSTDAYAFGNRLGVTDAYRFASGDEVTSSRGKRVKLRRPLDFLVIADHGENLGVVASTYAADPALLQTDKGKVLYEKLVATHAEPGYEMDYPRDVFGNLFETKDDSLRRYGQSIWRRAIASAEEYNSPGKFTAFIGYEWTAKSSGAPLHRVVIFKDGADKASQVLPFTSLDSKKPEDLWSYLADYERKTGGEILAIPHNPNLSMGQMFALQDSDGRPLTKAYAERRRRWEPLLEVTQVKGDSEAHPLLSPRDEFSDYETWNETFSAPHSEDWMRQYEYARSALKLGLDHQASLGVNPFKFGMIGGTDSHTSLSTADNDNFWGKNVVNGPDYPRRMLSPRYPDVENIELGWRLNAAGYAAVWATQNTREALFAAMKRKEVYASTGPRMTVRFFGGWDYKTGDASKPDLAEIGYTKGVPMGGDLTNPPKNKAPNFLIRAIKDPDGANLDRVQVIKGWRSNDGELHEQIYNVALSDGREEDSNGKAPPVGNTVNVKEASYTNTIGDPELAVVWSDPDFDPNELAFFYVRVLEIPTPRWTAYDAKFFNVADIPKEVPMTTQERAYTSPIWYSPAEFQNSSQERRNP